MDLYEGDKPIVKDISVYQGPKKFVMQAGQLTMLEEIKLVDIIIAETIVTGIGAAKAWKIVEGDSQVPISIWQTIPFQGGTLIRAEIQKGQ